MAIEELNTDVFARFNAFLNAERDGWRGELTSPEAAAAIVNSAQEAYPELLGRLAVVLCGQQIIVVEGITQSFGSNANPVSLDSLTRAKGTVLGFDVLGRPDKLAGR